MDVKNRIIVALDVSYAHEAEKLVAEISPYVGCFKIGLELITSIGAPQAVGLVRKCGGEIFFDGKFNDIPNTVGKASLAVSGMMVKMFNVHASCGIEAMAAAAFNKRNSLLLAVTVLTSLEENNAHLIFGEPSKAKVLQLARDAKLAGCDGIICSPQELEFLSKQKELANLLKVVPGIRPSFASADDQKRIMTPWLALKGGADYLVIGRPITNPPKEVGAPADAAKRILDEISSAS